MTTVNRQLDPPPSRLERTEVYRQLGVLWCGKQFEDFGLKHPSQQMMGVIEFIARDLEKSGDLIGAHDRQDIRAWARPLLQKIAVRLDRDPSMIERWKKAIIESVAIIAWNPMREFGELLQLTCGEVAFGGAARRLRQRGFDVGFDTVCTLTDQFGRQRLPRAICTFDPQRGLGKEASWLGQVFYRFAVQELVSDRSNRRNLAFFHESAPAAADVVEQEQMSALVGRLPSELDRMSPQHRTAIEMYFGLHGREHTIKEIATVIDQSEYKTRLVLIRTLAALATQFGVRGSLDPTEQKFLKLTLNDGLPASKAAAQLKVKRAGIQRRIDEKFCSALRERTTPDSTKLLIDRGRDSMNMKYAEFVRLGDRTFDKQIKTAIRDVIIEQGKQPRIETGDDGPWQVLLGKYRVGYDAVRQVIARDEELMRDLEERDSLDWLLPSDPSSERADVPEDAAEMDSFLESLRQRQWVQAEAIYELCEHEGNSSAALFKESKEETVERIFRVLTGVSLAIIAELPDESHERGDGEFILSRRSDGPMIAYWRDAGESNSMEIGSLIEREARAAGEFDRENGKLIAAVIADGILSGEFGLPGLDTTPRVSGDSVHFQWHEFDRSDADDIGNISK